MTRSVVVYVVAALAEIAGCFSVWLWLREGRSIAWLAPGMVCLVVFAWLLTLSGSALAGRAYAAYGGIICTSLAWLWAVEHAHPDRWDTLGAAICLIGAAIILLGPRAA